MVMSNMNLSEKVYYTNVALVLLQKRGLVEFGAVNMRKSSLWLSSNKAILVDQNQ